MSLEKEIGEKAKEGAFWNSLGAFSQEVIRFGFGIVMARLLLPEVFGIYGTVSVFTGLCSVIASLGLSATLIQKKDASDEYLATAYAINLGMALAMMLLLLALSPVIARYYEKPVLFPVLAVSSSILLINASFGVPTALLVRHFQFKNMALVSLITTVISGFLTVVLGLAGFGLWSLVLGGVIGPALMSVPFIILSGWRPRLRFDRAAFQEIFRFGCTIMASNLIWQLAISTDQFIIGKYVGLTELGLYSKAQGLIMLPLYKISTLVDYIAFPTYARLQHRKELLQAGYLKATLLLALAIFPIICGLAVLAPECVGVLYGPNWTGAVTPLRVLSIAALLMVIPSMAGSVLVAAGSPQSYFICQTCRLILLAVAALIGSWWGLVGVCWALCIANLMYLIIVKTFVMRFVGLTTKQLLANLLPPLTLTAVMAAVVGAYKLWVQFFFPINYYAFLITAVILGALTYLCAIRFFHFSEVDKIYLDVVNKFKEKLVNPVR